MAAKMSTLNVASKADQQQAITSYVAQGYVVSNQTEDAVTLYKKKEFNVVWAVIGFFLCLLPLLVYCIVYATQSDLMVIVRVDAAAAAANPAVVAGALGGELQWSDDRQYWWDGTQWIDANLTPPPGSQRSPDEQLWWDGESWRALPTPGEPQGESIFAATPESDEAEEQASN